MDNEELYLNNYAKYEKIQLEEKINNLRAWLQAIVDYSFDHDGCHNAKDLGELVDDLCWMAKQGLHGDKCLYGPATIKERSRLCRDEGKH